MAARQAYNFPMSESTTSERAADKTAETELRRLERRVEQLLDTLGALREENRALRQRQEVLSTERAGLVQRQEQVRTRVEAMIGRLKTLEHGT
jgi:cell division protein ZapB